MHQSRLLQPVLAFTMAWRGLRRSRGTSLLAVVVLALGLAAPVTFFSLLVGAIRPLPVPDGKDVVRVDVVQPARAGAPQAVRPAELETLQGAASLEALGGFREFGGTVVDHRRAAVRVAGASLTPEVLPLLRVEPAVGRIPGVDEAASTLLLGHDVWQEGYGGEADVLGRTVELNGEPRTVVGILPEGFGFPFNHDAWVILPLDPNEREPLELVGRLAPGADLAAATAELAGRWARLEGQRVEAERGAVLEVDGFTGGRGEGGEGVAFLGLVLVALALLLIACANVANLLLVRATERVRALGIQSALGAGRIQIGAQLLLEALLLSSVGGLAGVILADVFVGAIESGLSAEHFGYFWMRMAVDGRVLAFAGILVLGTALVAGTLPVLRVWRVDVQQVLKEEGASSGMGGGGMWGRAFVTVQLTLSCAALVAAALSGKSLNAVRGFGDALEGENVVLAALETSGRSDGSGLTLDPLESRLAAIPGVEEAALAMGAPGFGERPARLELGGARYDRPEDRIRTTYNAVTPSYFRMFGIELLAGRLLGGEDRAGTEPVAVVSQSFVRRHGGDGDVLGRRLRVMAGDTLQWYTVVGLVTDLDLGGGEAARRDRVYLSLSQAEAASVTLMVRGAEGAALAAPLREVVAEMHPDLPLWQVRTLADAHAYLIRVPRAMGFMALGGGAAGLLVAAVGLYGLLAFRVRQRRRELGVHLALGADGRSLALQTLGFGLKQVLPALALGLLASWLVAPILSAVIMGLDPRGWDTYAVVAASFLTVGLLASSLPAWRASRVDPARVLRGE